MVFLLVGAGLWLSVASGFLPLRRPGQVLQATLGSFFRRRSGKEEGITPFQAVSTALAGTLGTGNIAGVATAIVAGGPGAVFWMWCSALLGMATKYAEVLLAVEYRIRDREGRWQGGPMEYLARGLGMPWLAGIFCLFCALASFGIGNATQVGAVAQTMAQDFGLPPFLTGCALALLAGLVMMGGLRRIGAFTAAFVPLMALLYLGTGALVLVKNAAAIPDALSLIFRCAFTPQAAAGGAAGYTVRQAVHFGVARGVFTNEAGLGSAPIAHAGAAARGPVEQGCWGILEVFVDTILMCGFTALIILSGGELWRSGLDGAALTSAVFTAALGPLGGRVVSLSILLFAFSTVLGWGYYGERAIAWLTGERRWTVTLYRLCYLLVMVLAAPARLTLVWSLSDLLNGAMMVPNLIGVMALWRVVRGRTLEWEISRKKAGKAP
ncbi:MAG: sodium:alanine symporter family protein [Angelakisella sp.]|jgi:AGCS family alanine or glycine:cation symporter|nr:sodium:alanine symporter family protein [Angelakisella sp.]